MSGWAAAVPAAMCLLALWCWPHRATSLSASVISASVPPVSGHDAAGAESCDFGSADTHAVAAALDLLALALEGGAGLTQSIEVVADEIGGPLGAHLRVVSAALRWGMDEQVAWASLPEVWAPAARAMSMAGLAGVPPAQLLTRAAADLRRDEEQRLEVAAARLGVMLVLPLGLAFLPAFVLMTVLPVVLAIAGQILRHP